MTAMEYVKTRIAEDFGLDAPEIMRSLDYRMRQLDTPEEPDFENDGFQAYLSQTVYPFLSCERALEDSGYDVMDASDYVKTIAAEVEAVAVGQ